MVTARTYRAQMEQVHLVSFRTVVQETDLMIQADRDLADVSRDLVLRYRGHIEHYITLHGEFSRTLAPWPHTGPMPEVVQAMVTAARQAGVGPMAAVAGALAQQVGQGLLAQSREVVVENGGDLFVKLEKIATVGIYAGDSPLSMQVGVKIDSRARPVAVCTSSGTLGHSLSLGVADAATVIADSCSLADAAATAIGNRVDSPLAVESAIEYGRTIQGIRGLVVICGETIGAWGAVDLQRLGGKKG
ncbi:MAG: UPF0280 family protein [Desulfobacterales bacterium]|nr:UPF0280 family protein [Desulfobacterales bacterium]